MAIEDYYRTLTVQRKSTSSNGFGGPAQTYADAGTIEGLINQASSQEILAAAKLQNVVDSKLFTAVGVDIKVNDRIVDSIEGNPTYRIVSVPKNTVKRDHHWKTMLQRVDADV